MVNYNDYNICFALAPIRQRRQGLFLHLHHQRYCFGVDDSLMMRALANTNTVEVEDDDDDDDDDFDNNDSRYNGGGQKVVAAATTRRIKSKMLCPPSLMVIRPKSKLLTPPSSSTLMSKIFGIDNYSDNDDRNNSDDDGDQRTWSSSSSSSSSNRGKGVQPSQSMLPRSLPDKEEDRERSDGRNRQVGRSDGNISSSSLSSLFPPFYSLSTGRRGGGISSSSFDEFTRLWPIDAHAFVK